MYRQKISKKTSPLVNSTPISNAVPTSNYGSLSSIVQRAQQDVNSISADERQQLESAIGTKATGKVLKGKQSVPEFQGISGQFWGTVPVQAKLIIGEVGDKYEQEADRVAASVVKQINNSAPVSKTQDEVVQRKEEGLRMKPILQRREAIAGGEASAKLSGEINRARGGGQSLDAGLQKSMGQAMGADFSGVRVHRSARADSLNQFLGARAFTTGRDLFFRKGEYQPGSRQGQKLIAHELTHVVQQKDEKNIQRDVIEDIVLEGQDTEELKDTLESCINKFKDAIQKAKENVKDSKLLNVKGRDALNAKGRDARFYGGWELLGRMRLKVSTLEQDLNKWNKKWSIASTGGLLADLGLALKNVKMAIFTRGFKFDEITNKQYLQKGSDHVRKRKNRQGVIKVTESDWSDDLKDNEIEGKAGPSSTTTQLLRVVSSIGTFEDDEVEAMMIALIKFWKGSMKRSKLGGGYHTAAEVWAPYMGYRERKEGIFKDAPFRPRSRSL